MNSVTSESQVSSREVSRADANDRFSFGPLVRVEGGDGVVEGRDGADVCSQAAVADSLGDLA